MICLMTHLTRNVQGRCICSTDFSRWWTPLLGWCSHRRGTTPSLHFYANCTGWRQGSELISSSLSLSTIVSMEQHHRALPTNLASQQTSRLDVVCVSPLHRRAEPFRWPQLEFGTVCRSMSRLQRHCLFSTAAWRHTSLGAATLDCTHRS